MTHRIISHRTVTESIGTFLLVLMGGVAYLLLPSAESFAPLVSAVLLGSCFFALTLRYTSRSGSHFNPTFTLLFACTRYLPWQKVPLYIGAQMLGGLGGALVLRLMAHVLPGPFLLPPQSYPVFSLGLEMLLTVIILLLLLMMAMGDEQTGIIAPHGWLPALILSIFVAFGTLLADSLSWASMNPLQPFSFAVITGHFNDQWGYWIGSLLAVAVVALIYWILRRCTYSQT